MTDYSKHMAGSTSSETSSFDGTRDDSSKYDSTYFSGTNSTRVSTGSEELFYARELAKSRDFQDPSLGSSPYEATSEVTLSKSVLTDADIYTEPEKAQASAYWTYVPKRGGAGTGDGSASLEYGTHGFLRDSCLTRYPHLLEPQDTVVHQVQFKCSYRYYSTGAHGPKFYNVNEFVVVKGERGEDLGIVVGLFSNRIYLEKLQEEGFSVEDDEFKLRRILRLATKQERSELVGKEQDERVVAQYCADTAHHVFNLPMKILTAEYQFDRNKLVVYYAASVHVDFRELVKNIFATFKTSVWLKKVERGNQFVGRPHATVAMQTGVIYGR